MTDSRLIIFGVFEIIGLVIIVRMWIKRWHRRWIVRLIWSVVLLVPGFGILVYFFLRENPDAHPEYTEEFGGYGNGDGGGGDGH